MECDNAKAVELFDKAAKQGHDDAQCNLGWYYQHGTGVEHDMEKAVWYSSCAGAR